MPQHPALALPAAALLVSASAPLENSRLTNAERRVAESLARGWSNKEIAQVLDRAEATVKNQVAGILRKTGGMSRGRFIVRFHTGQLEPQFGDRYGDQAATLRPANAVAIAASGG